MSTFAQDSSNDIEVVNGQWVLITDPATEVAQVARNRLQFFRGEWFLDTRIGTPYYEFILGVKQPDMAVIERIFRDVLLSVPGLTKVIDLDIPPPNAQRQLSMFFRAETSTGAIISGGTSAPFIVEVP